MTTSTGSSLTSLDGERRDLLETLRDHRAFLRRTLRDLTDEQAAQRSTVSELCLGGLIKHMIRGERQWADFILDGPEAIGPASEESYAAHLASFRMAGEDTVAGLLAGYDAACARTDEIVATFDLDAARPLPPAPWFAPGAAWSARRVLLHLIAETAQHAGHADIIREAIDGAKSMG